MVETACIRCGEKATGVYNHPWPESFLCPKCMVEGAAVDVPGIERPAVCCVCGKNYSPAVGAWCPECFDKYRTPVVATLPATNCEGPLEVRPYAAGEDRLADALYLARSLRQENEELRRQLEEARGK